MDNTIRIRGAREHNLKNISVEIPRDKLIVITGLSGMNANVSAISGGTVSYYVIYSGQLTNRAATITAYVSGTWT